MSTPISGSESYPVIYDAENGLNYIFQNRLVSIATGGTGGIDQLTGEVTAGPGTGSQAAIVSNTAVITKVLTGYVSGAGAVAATDTILQAINKLNGNDALKLPLTGGTLTGDLTISEASTANLILHTTSHTGIIEVSDPLGRMALRFDGNPWLLFNGSEIRTTAYAFDFTGVPIYGNGDASMIGAGANPPVSAILSATSVTMGFLPPRMTTTQKNAIVTPAEGLIVYDITTHKLSLFTGTVWETITSV